MIVFSSTFDGATDPGLVPIPWDSTIVESGNTLAYTATEGDGGGPGMKVTMGGTMNSSNGFTAFSESTIFVETAEKIPYWQWRMNLQTIGLDNGDRPILVRLRNGSSNILDFKLFMNVAVVQCSLHDRVGSGGTVDGTTTIAAATWNTFRIEPVAASNAWRLLLNGTPEVTVNVGATLTDITSMRFGPMGGAIPNAGADYRFDSIEVDDGVQLIPPGPGVVTAAQRAMTGLGVW